MSAGITPLFIGTGWPISRVLCPRTVTGPEAAIIHLGTPLPAPSSGLPGHIGRAALKRVLYGLAPGGVYLAVPVTRDAGGLLHHLFTLTCGPVKVDPPAVCFLWHWPAGFPEWALPTTLLCGARTFLGGTLSKKGTNAIAWPTRPASMLPPPHRSPGSPGSEWRLPGPRVGLIGADSATALRRKNSGCHRFRF